MLGGAHRAPCSDGNKDKTTARTFLDLEIYPDLVTFEASGLVDEIVFKENFGAGRPLMKFALILADSLGDVIAPQIILTVSCFVASLAAA